MRRHGNLPRRDPAAELGWIRVDIDLDRSRNRDTQHRFGVRNRTLECRVELGYEEGCS